MPAVCKNAPIREGMDSWAKDIFGCDIALLSGDMGVQDQIANRNDNFDICCHTGKYFFGVHGGKSK